MTQMKRYGLIMTVTAVFATLSTSAYALSFGDIAQNLLGFAGNLNDLFDALCILVGAGLILGSLMQYLAHRRNPIEVPLSKPIALLIVGIVVLLLTLIPMPG